MKTENFSLNCSALGFDSLRHAPDATAPPVEPERGGMARRRRGGAAPAADERRVFGVSGSLRPRRSASAPWMCWSTASTSAADADGQPGGYVMRETCSTSWMQTGCAQVRPPTRPAHPSPGVLVRTRKRAWGMIGAGLQVWGCLHALPAPTRDPAGDPTPRFAPCVRRPDLASGPEAPAGGSWRVFRGQPGRAQSLQPWCPSTSDAESARRRLPTRFDDFGLLVLSGAFRVVGSRAGWSTAGAGMVGQGCSSVRAAWEGQELAGGSRRAPKWPRAACHPGPYVRRHFACYPGSAGARVAVSRVRRPKSC